MGTRHQETSGILKTHWSINTSHLGGLHSWREDPPAKFLSQCGDVGWESEALYILLHPFLSICSYISIFPCLDLLPLTRLRHSPVYFTNAKRAHSTLKPKLMSHECYQESCIRGIENCLRLFCMALTVTLTVFEHSSTQLRPGTLEDLDYV